MTVSTSDSVATILSTLQNLEGINGMNDLASVIGSPAQATDPMATMVQNIQNGKTNIQNAITSQGGTVTNTSGGSVPLYSDLVNGVNGIPLGYRSGNIVPFQAVTQFNTTNFSKTYSNSRGSCHCLVDDTIISITSVTGAGTNALTKMKRDGTLVVSITAPATGFTNTVAFDSTDNSIYVTTNTGACKYDQNLNLVWQYQGFSYSALHLQVLNAGIAVWQTNQTADYVLLNKSSGAVITTYVYSASVDIQPCGARIDETNGKYFATQTANNDFYYYTVGTSTGSTISFSATPTALEIDGVNGVYFVVSGYMYKYSYSGTSLMTVTVPVQSYYANCMSSDNNLYAYVSGTGSSAYVVLVDLRTSSYIKVPIVGLQSQPYSICFLDKTTILASASTTIISETLGYKVA